MHIWELGAAASRYSSFAHAFVLGVGPEGVVVWQAWGEHGCRLDEWVRDGHARVRSFEEGDAFVSTFERLVARKGAWKAKVNKLYKKLFHVDIDRVCGPGGPQKAVTPRFKPWVRILKREDVTNENMGKFLWSLDHA